MDDLLQIYKPNEQYNLKETFSKIYDKALKIEQTNITNDESNFLDLTLMINRESNSIVSKLYNKTDDYNFKIRRYPHFTSNIPTSIGLNTIKGEIIRFSRCCSEVNYFLERVEAIIKDFEFNKFPTQVIYNRCIRVLQSNTHILNKYPKKEIYTFINHKKSLIMNHK